jgi:hypothetical protein
MSKKAKKKYVKKGTIKMFDGMPVVDATEDIEINITAADVRNSKRKDPGGCAAAVAGKRELHTPVKVFLSRVYVKNPKKAEWVRFITPNAIAREIVSFDRSSLFEPGEYSFKAPGKTARLGYDNRRRPNNGHDRKKKKKDHVTANVRVSAKGSYQNERAK